METINTLPEIAETLYDKGFSIEIADDHSQIFVTLTSRILRTREVCDALGWEWDTIPSNVTMYYQRHGIIIRDDCSE